MMDPSADLPKRTVFLDLKFEIQEVIFLRSSMTTWRRNGGSQA
jgi:hypothetical protein